jgi:hypothetical protein
VLLVCDVTNALAGRPSVTKFNAIAGTKYTVVIEGYQATGIFNVTCKMGVAPPVPEAPKYCLVAADGSIQLNMPATNWCPFPVTQWRFNGANLAGETNAVLLVTNFTASKAGAYSVVMSNFVSVTTNTVAYLALAGPFVLGRAWATNIGKVDFVVTASNATPFILQTTTNLGAFWQPLATNLDPCLMLIFTNKDVLLDRQRFFRAVPGP